MPSILLARGKHFLAEVMLRSHFRARKPSTEEIDFLMQVLGPLLANLGAEQDETQSSVGACIPNQTDEVPSEGSQADASSSVPTGPRGFRAGTQ